MSSPHSDLNGNIKPTYNVRRTCSWYARHTRIVKRTGAQKTCLLSYRWHSNVALQSQQKLGTCPSEWLVAYDVCKLWALIFINTSHILLEDYIKQITTRHTWYCTIAIPVSLWCHQMETFSCNWSFVMEIHRSPVDSPHKAQWHRKSPM